MTKQGLMMLGKDGMQMDMMGRSPVQNTFKA